LSNTKDDFHQNAKQCLRELAAREVSLITTCAVLTKTCHVLLRRGGDKAQRHFIIQYQNRFFQIFELTPEYASRISELMEKYADLPMDLADASLVILAEHLGHGQILSTDQRDFHAYRWKNHEPFENLLIK